MFNLLDNLVCRNRMAGCRLGSSAILLALLLPVAGQAQSDLPRLLRLGIGQARPGAQATAPAPPAAPVSRLIGEILELDARRALLIEQRENTSASSLGPVPLGPVPLGAGQPPAAADEPSTAQPSGQPVAQLQAIVGVGRDLSALVVRANDRWVFRTGRPSPVAGPDTDLRLVRIKTPCAVFRTAPQASARQPPATEPGAAVEPAGQQTLCLQHVPP